MVMIEKMKALVKRKDICVLATVSDNNPHCSLMAYVTDDDCSEIYMVTNRQTTKFRNLSANPLVSLLIDTREEHTGMQRPHAQALTVSGLYEEIQDETRKTRIQSRLLAKHPHIKDLMDMPDAEIFCVKVTSFLLLDGLSEAHFETL
jgi:nitroimidazol reductase NimA-like FMN-containing flavoprotein (pyridoxamine 5'-phosphate oxidase superfamily)